MANKLDTTPFIVVKLARPDTLKAESENRITEEDDHATRIDEHHGEIHV